MSKLPHLLSCLDKVKRTGQDSYIACCPAHGDKNPSMTIREVDDGRILMHCFAGCSVEEILGSIGMTFDDLFPEDMSHDHKRPERQPFNARDVLAAVSSESLIVAIAGADIANGKPTTTEDRKRLALAVSRLQEAARLCNV